MLMDKPEIPYEKLKGLLIEKASSIDFVKKDREVLTFRNSDEPAWSAQKKEQMKSVMNSARLTGELSRYLNVLFEKIDKKYESPLFLGYDRHQQTQFSYQNAWKLYNSLFKVSRIFPEMVVRCVPVGSHLHHFLIYAHKNYESNSLLPPIESIHVVGGAALVFMKAPLKAQANKNDKKEEEYVVECLYSSNFPSVEMLEKMACFHNVSFHKIKEMFEFLHPLVQRKEFLFSISNDAPRFVRFDSQPQYKNQPRFCFWNPFYYKDRYK